MPGSLQCAVLYTKFYKNRFSGFAAVSGRKSLFPVTLAIGLYNSLYHRTSCDATFYWSAILSLDMLYHFRVIWRIIVTLKNITEGYIQTGTIRKLGCGFLFAFHSNYGRIFNRLWYSVTLKTGLGLFQVIENSAVR